MLLLDIVAVMLCSMTLVGSALIAISEKNEARTLGVIVSIVLVVAIVALTLNIALVW